MPPPVQGVVPIPRARDARATDGSRASPNVRGGHPREPAAIRLPGPSPDRCSRWDRALSARLGPHLLLDTFTFTTLDEIASHISVADATARHTFVFFCLTRTDQSPCASDRVAVLVRSL